MKFLIGALALAAPALAAAQSMPLRSFLDRATRLEKKGPMALFHRGEINMMMTEMKGASAAVKAERQAAVAAGRPAAYCPPAGSKGVKMGPQQLLAELRTASAGLPATATTTDGFRAMLARRYPCPRG